MTAWCLALLSVLNASAVSSKALRKHVELSVMPSTVGAFRLHRLTALGKRALIGFYRECADAKDERTCLFRDLGGMAVTSAFLRIDHERWKASDLPFGAPVKVAGHDAEAFLESRMVWWGSGPWKFTLGAVGGSTPEQMAEVAAPFAIEIDRLLAAPPSGEEARRRETIIDRAVKRETGEIEDEQLQQSLHR